MQLSKLKPHLLPLLQQSTKYSLPGADTFDDSSSSITGDLAEVLNVSLGANMTSTPDHELSSNGSFISNA